MTTLLTVSSGKWSRHRGRASFNDAYGRRSGPRPAAGSSLHRLRSGDRGRHQVITDVDTTQTSDFTGRRAAEHALGRRAAPQVAVRSRFPGPHHQSDRLPWQHLPHGPPRREPRGAELRGWDSVNNMPTGPTQVSRQDLAGVNGIADDGGDADLTRPAGWHGEHWQLQTCRSYTNSVARPIIRTRISTSKVDLFHSTSLGTLNELLPHHPVVRRRG